MIVSVSVGQAYVGQPGGQCSHLGVGRAGLSTARVLFGDFGHVAYPSGVWSEYNSEMDYLPLFL